MKNAADAPLYRLLVDLAEFNPETARPGDWLNYRVGLDELTGHGAAALTTRVFNVGNPQRVGDLAFIEAEVRPIHADLRRLVREFAARGPLHPVEITVRIAVSVTEGLLVEGSTRSAALLVAARLLDRPGQPPPIALCPEDDRLFVRVRHQLYCSRQCVNRANMRAHRQRALAPPTPPKKKKRRSR